MVLNSDFILLHKQSPLDRKAWVDLLGLSDEEATYIDESVRPGEGLLVAGAARVPIKDDFPRGELYDLFNTKPDEVAEARRAAGDTGRLARQAGTDLPDPPAQEAGYIDESVRAGEGLLVAGGARVPIKDDFPKGALYDLFNTKPEEIAALKRAAMRGGSAEK